ncbi:hypothetical protein F5884DRAFT_108541 [Xylogone sp. PMI_703]|nr:hypothetical protein F5884DRAFT_108541 [Xylogone sp. PMI_703]
MPRTILVVGANKGIGFAIVELLARRSTEDHLLIGARNLQRGNDAVVELRRRGVTARLDVVQIDITSDNSIRSATEDVRQRFQKLDILVNNAAIGRLETLETIREIYRAVFDTNVASVILTCETFLPLLRETSDDPRIIQVSTARSSISRIQSGKMPAAVAVSYGASKAALNLATLELSKRPENEKVLFQAAAPGHCKTDFNNNTGFKDPLDGARVIADLALEKRGNRKYGLWEIENDDTEPTLVPW